MKMTRRVAQGYMLLASGIGLLTLMALLTHLEGITYTFSGVWHALGGEHNLQRNDTSGYTGCRSRVYPTLGKHPLDLSDDLTNQWPNPPMDTLAEFINCGFHPKLLSFVNVTIDPIIKLVKVPNSVHYVRFGSKMKFTFIDHVSMVGASKFIKPMYVFLHGDILPRGTWWQRTLKQVPNLYFLKTEQPKKINGRKISYIQHTSDIVRMNILLQFGGIYLDRDVLPVKSFDPLRVYDLVLGRELPGSLANGIIVARKGAPFLRIWHETYRDYRPKKWAYNSVSVPSLLSDLLPHLIHIELKSLVRPNYLETKLLYDSVYDWSRNYCVHLYKGRGVSRPSRPEDIDRKNSTVGQIMRLLYYGDVKFRV